MAELSPANLELGLEQPLPGPWADLPLALGTWARSPGAGGGSGVRCQHHPPACLLLGTCRPVTTGDLTE